MQGKLMPRKARIDAPGALHHIVIRGIERKPIFKDSLDYQNFKAARKSYFRFVGKAINQGHRPELVGGGLVRSVGGWSALKALRDSETRMVSDERILGSSEFVEKVLKSANEAYERKTKIRAKGIRLSQLIDNVTARLEVDLELILSPSRQRTVALARSIICCLAVDQLMLSNTFVAGRLNLTPSSVSKLVSRGRLEAETRKIAIDNLAKVK
jgi:putative transposase